MDAELRVRLFVTYITVMPVLLSLGMLWLVWRVRRLESESAWRAGAYPRPKSGGGYSAGEFLADAGRVVRQMEEEAELDKAKLAASVAKHKPERPASG